MRASIVLLATSLLVVSGTVQAATLVVANKSDDTVDLVDLSTGKSTATLSTGHAPHEVVASPDGRTIVVSNYGDREDPGSTLTVIDRPSAKVVRTIDLGEHPRPHGMAWIDGNRIAVTSEGSRTVLVVDVAKGAIEREIPTNQEISHMVVVSPDRTRAFVSNIGSGTETVVDLESGKKLVDLATGAGAEGNALRPGTNEVWVANREADTLSVIDARSAKVIETMPCAGFPIRIAFTPDGARAIVSAARSGEVVLIDAVARKELARKTLDFATAPDAAKRLFGDRFGKSPVPVGIRIAPDGKSAFVAATQADVVVKIDTATLDVVDLIRAGREPDGMALVP